uniref:Uncharacterized protein n=1 Tax=Rhizophora mucronata TaxID=61149 RepID=A0A2P2PDP6_RHIMU
MHENRTYIILCLVIYLGINPRKVGTAYTFMFLSKVLVQNPQRYKLHFPSAVLSSLFSGLGTSLMLIIREKPYTMLYIEFTLM